MTFSKRELYIKDKIGLDEESMIKLSQIAKKLNTNKYNVWLAKEAKKNFAILNDYSKISDIVDWIKYTKNDIMKFDFNSASFAQKEWHTNLYDFPKIKQKICSQEIDEDRVVFINSTGDYFFYILKIEDLSYESEHMMHCIGWNNTREQYENKIKKQQCIFLSLRNEHNLPLLTIEIDLETGQSLQIRGKKNADITELSHKIKRTLVEFVLFAGDFKHSENSKLLDLINNNLNYF